MPLNPLFRHDPFSTQERSPSPPRRFVEPLSPVRPKPIEPNFNYPALNNHVDFTVRPEQAYTATPKARERSSSYKHTHHHTPSTIDTLAEAALAVSPGYQQQSTPARHGHPTTYPMPSTLGRSEPPHKRTRSEIFPTPVMAPYASRPATSYEHNSAWHGHGQQQHAGNINDSRAEEAALLLGLRQDVRTSSFTPRSTHLPPPSTPGRSSGSVARPHANSFPQRAPYPRPSEYQSHTPLLPPFQPYQNGYARPYHPSPQQTNPEVQPSPMAPMRDAQYRGQYSPVGQYKSPVHADVNMVDAPQQSRTHTHKVRPRAESTDVVIGEASGPAATTKRAQKGKARSASSRKPAGERKTAAKRAANRKKTPDVSKTSRSTSEAVTDDWSTAGDDELNRRKSFSGRTTERPHLSTVSEGRAKSVPAETPMIVRPASPTKRTRPKPKINPETICAGCHTTRETAYANAELDAWISCNGCKQWFHVDCAGYKKATEVRDVDKYFCSPCEPTHGKTTYVRKSTRAHTSVDYAELQRGVLKTSEESQEHHYIQPIKDGTFQFDPESFPRMRPELVTREFFERSGTFVEPICIPAAWNPRPWLNKKSKTNEAGDTTTNDDDDMNDLTPDEYEYDTVPDDGQDRLGMVMPEELTVRQVCNLVGPEIPLDVIDVKTQNSGAKWNLGRWADYYEEESDDKPIRNVISLEVSQSKLGRLLKRPQVVRDIDLQDEVWPQKELDQGKWPKVQFYCLMSVADSYTDFHIDFGGSSVYYHILKGKKTFFFIPPKAKHLKAYEEWNDSHQQNYTFLPHITKECYRVDLSEGDTMLIPSGWIHAVWTPETSLVIGGNFLSRMSFKNQFKVVEIEKANETPMKFRYPFFQKLMWYTAIDYMQKDPLPDAVSQMFYDGKRFERQRPVWADFDGDMASEDPRPGAKNARYYSEAEIEGLPDLVNFIFRTVMLVQGRVEGITQDRMKRVNASIPKGHGEPLEVAKKFALWVAWKRGNEDPPAWAHPDAVLPNSKEEGPPKKLSARALKDMERKEAIAAWRVAPDRQSARIKSGAAAESRADGPAANFAPTSTTKVATPDRTSSLVHHQITPPHSSEHPYAHHQMLAHAPAAQPPMAHAMNGWPSTYISTPKTSVLGPKRVACDACRKRRIKCKHKELVQQASPDGTNGVHMSPGAYGISPQLHDSITGINGTPNGAHANGGPLPGTDAYIHANIPMTMNGVQMFGDQNKRGRSKACVECRKSKRRCIHDESGNVDPIKAAETPVPRGSVASKKRTAEEGDEGTPSQPNKKLKTISPVRSSNSQPPSTATQHPPTANGSLHKLPPAGEVHHQTTAGPSGYHQHSPAINGYHQPSTAPSGYHPDHHQSPAPNGYHQASSPPQNSHVPSTSSREQNTPQAPQEAQQSHAPIDPSLFAYSEETNHSAYPDPSSHSAYQPTTYPYPATERPRLYQLPSLEQIASDVLNFEDGPEQDYQAQQHHDAEPHVHVYNPSDLGAMPNGLPTSDSAKPDESADSAISLPGSELSDHDAKQADPSEPSLEQIAPEADAKPIAVHHGSPIAQPSSQANATISTSIEQASPAARKNSVGAVPLYQPPAPPSQSPEQVKRMPHLVNGGMNSSPKSAMSNKRKRNSTSHTPGPKRVKAGSDEPVGERTAAELSSLELAKVLQQEDIGLRQRVN